MSAHLDDPEILDLARRLSEATGEDLAAAVRRALRESLARSQRRRGARKERLDALQQEAARLPLRDRRSAEDILGYDDSGLPR